MNRAVAENLIERVCVDLQQFDSTFLPVQFESTCSKSRVCKSVAGGGM